MKLEFEHPEYISVLEHDTVILIFKKNNFWLRPKDENFLAIPDDFKIVFALAPQTKEAMKEETKESITKSTRSFFFTHILIQEWFKKSMQLVFGQIIAL